MRTVSRGWRALVPYSHAIVTRVDSYRGGQLLAPDVPVKAGVVKYDDTGVVRRRLTLTVPARDGLTRWDPGNDPYAPLAAYGQRLRVRTGVGYVNGLPELVDLGEFLITRWGRDEPSGAIEVEAVDLAQLIVDAELTQPTAPPASATYASEFDRLVRLAGPTGLWPVIIDAGLVDRPIGTGTVVYEDRRDEAIATLMSAWPARWYVGDDGRAHAGPPYGPVSATDAADLLLTDGATGTVTGRGRTAERGAIANMVVVRGKASAISGVAPYHLSYVDDPASPIYVSGPYGRVVRRFQSDLITNQTQAADVGDALLRQYSTVGRAERLSCVPDPSWELGDIGRAYTSDGDAWVGRVTTIELPLTPADAPMLIGLSNQPGVNA